MKKAKTISLASSLTLVHLLSALFALAIGAFFYRVAWNDYIRDAGEETRKDVSVVASIIKSNIAEGSRYVELAGKQVEQAIASGQAHTAGLEAALNRSLDAFRIMNDVRSYGILLLLDRNGKIIARSDGRPLDGRSFSDRYFFKRLASDPALEFIVGPMVVARTTRRTVFHVAVPVHAPDRQFFGVLALQLDVEHIASKIADELIAPRGIVSTVSNGDQVVLRMPMPPAESYGENGMVFTPVQDLPVATSHAQWFSLKESVISMISIPEVRLAVFSDLSKKDIRSQYMKAYYPSVILIVLGLLVYSCLMYLLDKKIRELAVERNLSLTDRLTNLPNRRAFDERYQNLLKEARRNRQPVSLLFIDIDHFKECNDRYGHDNGDIVLKAVGDLIRHTLSRPLDCCFRWGGEEMVCLLEDTDSKGARQVARKILDSVRQTPIALPGLAPIHITVSIGVATANYSETPLLIDLVGAADHAMYRAKQAGRDQLDATVVSE